MDARKGMWVLHKGRVGILAEVDQRTETGEVHYVNELGVTIETVAGVLLSGVAMAAYDNIPEPRRPAPDVARNFGYL